MPNVLPMFFVAMAFLALGGALVALWASLRRAWDSNADLSYVHREQEHRERLLDEKHSLLRGLKDLELDVSSGKLSDEDYKQMNDRLRTRAKDVLHALDEDLGPYLEKAEALLRAASGAPATPAGHAPVPGAPAHKSCATCQTSNDGDAVFCKKCGARMSEAAS